VPSKSREPNPSPTWDVVGSDIDDDATRLEPFALDESRLTDGSDDDIRVLELLFSVVRPTISMPSSRNLKPSQTREIFKGTHNVLQPSSPRVTLSDGRISPPQQSADGGTDDIRSTEDDDVGSGDLGTSWVFEPGKRDQRMNISEVLVGCRGRTITLTAVD
jgi:hypothetical protein